MLGGVRMLSVFKSFPFRTRLSSRVGATEGAVAEPMELFPTSAVIAGRAAGPVNKG